MGVGRTVDAGLGTDDSMSIGAANASGVLVTARVRSNRIDGYSVRAIKMGSLVMRRVIGFCMNGAGN